MANDAVLIGSDVLGSPDRELGRVLVGNFLRLLGEREELPLYIILWNGGALLAADDSPHLDYLKRLQERGVTVVICRTCVEYFGLEGKIAVGEIDGMVRILDILSKHQVLTI